MAWVRVVKVKEEDEYSTVIVPPISVKGWHSEEYGTGSVDFKAEGTYIYMEVLSTYNSGNKIGVFVSPPMINDNQYKYLYFRIYWGRQNIGSSSGQGVDNRVITAYGSNDGSKWTSYSSMTFNYNSGDYEQEKEYTFSLSSSYKYYRIEFRVTVNRGSSGSSSGSLVAGSLKALKLTN